MLPAAFRARASLADVLPGCLAAISGDESALRLPPVRAAVVVLVDGLGAAALRARAGHART
ncbi:MAG: alkaline phosphatase family protein, partial [Actinomycetota bacterium]|nr:alkaline phosphatase family protein [Actinomycetota bacterium]